MSYLKISYVGIKRTATNASNLAIRNSSNHITQILWFVNSRKSIVLGVWWLFYESDESEANDC